MKEGDLFQVMPNRALDIYQSPVSNAFMGRLWGGEDEVAIVTGFEYANDAWVSIMTRRGPVWTPTIELVAKCRKVCTNL